MCEGDEEMPAGRVCMSNEGAVEVCGGEGGKGNGFKVRGKCACCPLDGSNCAIAKDQATKGGGKRGDTCTNAGTVAVITPCPFSNPYWQKPTKTCLCGDYEISPTEICIENQQVEACVKNDGRLLDRDCACCSSDNICKLATRDQTCEVSKTNSQKATNFKDL